MSFFVNSCQNNIGLLEIVAKIVFGLLEMVAKIVFGLLEIVAKIVFGLLEMVAKIVFGLLEIVFVRLNLINHLVGFISCQICLYFSI